MSHPVDPRSPEVLIRIAEVDDWAERRDLRLEMLADTPIAFTDTLEAAAGYSAEDWRAEARRATRPDGCTIVAVAGVRWVGTMSGYASTGDAHLVTVYVSPDWRGRARGVADRLLDGIEGWVARETRSNRLVLSVHEDNVAAQRFYLRRGFTPTGRTQPYPLDPTRRDLEFARSLGTPGNEGER